MTEDVDNHVMAKYEIKKRLGKGAYGIVWKAIDRRTGEIVALKKIFDAFRNQTDAQRTFREIMFLKEFSTHANIVKLLNVLKANNDRDIYLVFEYMDTDLHNVIKKGDILKDIHKRYIMYQLFRAIKYLHSGNVIHRDLKPSNVLLDADCTAKLADFGLARSLSQYDQRSGKADAGQPELTEYVATRWYRAPEILLAAKRYTKGVDMWSLGCILGEMYLGKALFPGTSTINQIERIMNIITTPSKADIDSIGSVYAGSVIEKMNARPRTSLDSLLAGSPFDAVDLMKKLLVFNPEKRWTADEALRHPYVAPFHNPDDEPSLNYSVTLSLSDDIQLQVADYRNKLYELINTKKSQVRRISKQDNHKPPSATPQQPQQQYARSESPPPPAPSYPQLAASKSQLENNAKSGSGTKKLASYQAPSAAAVSRNNGAAPIAESECSDTDYETAKTQRSGRLAIAAAAANGAGNQATTQPPYAVLNGGSNSNLYYNYNPSQYHQNGWANVPSAKALDSSPNPPIAAKPAPALPPPWPWPPAQRPSRAHSADAGRRNHNPIPASQSIDQLQQADAGQLHRQDQQGQHQSHQKSFYGSSINWLASMAPKSIFRHGSKKKNSSAAGVMVPPYAGGASSNADYVAANRKASNGSIADANVSSLGAPKMTFGSYTQNHGTITAAGLQALRHITGNT